MVRMQRNGRPVFIFMVLVAVSIALPWQYALAALVPTDALASPVGEAGGRARLQQVLAREDVRAMLAAQGLEPEEARLRAASLTEAEVRQLVDRIDRLPAGAGGLGVVIGVLIFVAIILVILKATGTVR